MTIPALRRMWQAVLCEFQASLSYKVKTLSQNKTKRVKNIPEDYTYDNPIYIMCKNKRLKEIHTYIYTRMHTSTLKLFLIDKKKTAVHLFKEERIRVG